jgi:hypothetical protein
MSAWDEPRCSWCSGRTGPFKEIRVGVLPNALVGAEEEAVLHVHPEHEASFRRFNDDRNRYARPVVVALIVLSLLTVPLAFWSEVWSSALLVPLGMLLVRFPFATGTTYEVISTRASIHLIRAAGVGFILFGAWFVLLELL